MTATFSEFLVDLLQGVLDNTKEVYTKVLVVPSSDDACFENVHPQLPASLDRDLKSDRLVT
jgi:hypothetical protein